MSMVYRLGTIGFAAALLVAAGMADAWWSPETAPSQTIDVVPADSVVCAPGADESDRIVAVVTGGDGEFGRLRQDPRALADGTPEQRSGMKEPWHVSIGAGGAAAASVWQAPNSGIYRGLAAASCVRPATESWLVGVRSTKQISTVLTLVNPESEPASVDLRMWGPDGVLPAQGATSIDVPARGDTDVTLGPLAQVEGPFTIRVTARSGRVGVVAYERVFRSEAAVGTDAYTATAVPPGTDLLLSGVPQGKGKRTVVVTNPGERRAKVSVTAITAEGTVALVGAQDVSVPAASTVAIDVAGPLAGAAGAVRVTATRPVVAGLEMTSGSAHDRARLGVTPAWQGTALATVWSQDAESALVLSNSTDRDEASGTVSFLGRDGVSLGSARFSIAGGHARVVAVPDDQIAAVRVAMDSGSVAGTVVQRREVGGIAGVAAVPLTSPAASAAQVDPAYDVGLGS